MTQRLRIFLFICLAFTNSRVWSQDNPVVLYFSNIVPVPLEKPVLFKTVKVIDERSATQTFYNPEIGIKPHVRVRYEPRFQQELECYLNSLLPSKSTGQLTAIFHVKELRVYNQPDYSFKDETNSLVYLSTQQYLKLNVDVYFKDSSGIADSTFHFCSFNRFYAFKGFGFVKRTAIRAIRDLLTFASDTANSEKRQKLIHSIAKRSIGVRGDNIVGTGPAEEIDPSIKRDAFCDSLRTYDTYQDFIDGTPDGLSGRCVYDSTTGSYRLLAIPEKLKRYPSFARQGFKCYKRVFGNYFWLISKTDSGYNAEVPANFPDIYSLYSFLEAGRGHTKSLGSANNLLQLLILGVVEAAVSESDYQRKLKTMLHGHQVKEVVSFTLPVDPISGDILY